MRPLWRSRPPHAEGTSRAAALETAAAKERSHAAPGLAVVFSRLAANRRSRVLDLGPAVADNVALLGPLAAQLWVVDSLRDGGGPAALGALRLARGAPFDIVLAWEVLDHLQPELVDGFVHELAGYCRPGTLLHAVAFSSESVPARPGRYHITDRDRIAYRPVTTEARLRPPLAPAEFEKRLAGFQVEHAVVLRHGVREFLAVRCPAGGG